MTLCIKRGVANPEEILAWIRSDLELRAAQNIRQIIIIVSSAPSSAASLLHPLN